MGRGGREGGPPGHNHNIQVVYLFASPTGKSEHRRCFGNGENARQNE